MAYQKVWRRQKEWSPAAVGTNETTALFPVKSGWRVIAASARVLTAWAASSTPTFTLGDGSDVDGFITDANGNEETAGLYDGTGAYFATSGGKLYTSDDTIDVDYVAGATPGATTGKVRFTVLFTKDED